MIIKHFQFNSDLSEVKLILITIISKKLESNRNTTAPMSKDHRYDVCNLKY